MGKAINISLKNMNHELNPQADFDYFSVLKGERLAILVIILSKQFITNNYSLSKLTKKKWNLTLSLEKEITFIREPCERKQKCRKFLNHFRIKNINDII